MKSQTADKTAVALASLSRLLEYPRADFKDALEQAIRILSTFSEGNAAALLRFKSEIAMISSEQLEEIYTRTFDLAPICVPYLSSHIYGDENFERGALMSRLAQRYQKVGFELNGELPDHLSVIFGFAPQFDQDELLELMTFCLKSAVTKMKEALLEAENPFAHILETAAELIASELEGKEL